MGALIRMGADVNGRGIHNCTPLLYATGYVNYASEAECTMIVKLLIGAGADVDARAKGGETALFHTVRMGHVDSAKLLIGAGADVNARDPIQSTPLHLAAMCNAPLCVELFIERGANVEAADSRGGTPLTLAQKWKPWSRCCRCITERAEEVWKRRRVSRRLLACWARGGSGLPYSLVLEIAERLWKLKTKKWSSASRLQRNGI